MGTTCVQVATEARENYQSLLELVLCDIVIHLMWVLGTKPGYSARAVPALKQ